MNEHPYDRLKPDMVIDAVESAGYLSDARLLALNSYENRVYQVGIEDGTPLIAKFYRPERWSDAQILEEHAFSLELQAADISVVAPMVDSAGRTLHEFEGFRFALFQRRGIDLFDQRGDLDPGRGQRVRDALDEHIVAGIDGVDKRRLVAKLRCNRADLVEHARAKGVTVALELAHQGHGFVE